MPGTLSVRLLADEEPVRTLLVDLLRDKGIRLEEGAPESRRGRVLLAQVGRGRGLLHTLLDAQAQAYGSPVVLVLPAQDERLAAQALRLGAAACYSLGGPVTELFEALAAAAQLQPELREVEP